MEMLVQACLSDCGHSARYVTEANLLYAFINSSYHHQIEDRAKKSEKGFGF